MSKITILHLSDIHFKKNKDEENKTYRKDVSKKMVSKIEEHINKNNLDLDFVAVTGDIAFSGREYDEAKNFFNELKLILPETIFLAVPGNHDVDRDKVMKFFSLHDIVKKKQTDEFLEDEKVIKGNINVKFESFRQFVKELNPEIYRSEDDYFWVKNFEDKNVSFLGLNSCWASENDNDRFKITLGYPQVMNALEMSKISNKILLMHHPFDWFYEPDFNRSHGELFKKCGLVLHGHIHTDKAFAFKDPSNFYICLGANASYTNDKEGRVGFQFVRVEFQEKAVAVRVWPYILYDIRNEFVPDRERWKGQKGKKYFDLNIFEMYSEESGKIVSPPEIVEAYMAYTDWVGEFHSTISFDQLAKKGEALPVQLLKVYIPLETANPFHKAEMERVSKDRGEKSRLEMKDELGEEDELKEPSTIDIEELLGRIGCVLLRGKAGMGKTTLIKHLTNTITQRSCHTSLRDYLPVMVFLKDLWPIYNEELQKSGKNITFEPLLKAYFEKIKCPLSWEVISIYLSWNKALFLLDGLDEIPEEIRDDLVNIIAEFQSENKNNRFLLTGRPHGITGSATDIFGKYLRDIEYLDDEKINDFIKKWFRAVSGQATGLADMTAEDMISDIRLHEHVSVFTQNPLLLAGVCVLYLVGKRIPEQRADLYDRIVENLLWRRFHDPKEPEREGEVAEYLMALAFKMQVGNLKSIEESDAKEVLKKIIPMKDSGNERVYLRQINGLFKEIEPNCGLLNRLSGGEIEFSHLTFQEFLAAKYMVDMDKYRKKFLEEDWWEETIVLYAGYTSLNMKQRSNDIVKDILKEGDEKSLHRLWLLGSRALRDFQKGQRFDETVSLALEKLYELIESEASLEERFEAGVIVGTLGDQRIKADNMVLVEGGEFIRGSSEDEASYDDEKPQRSIYLDDFMIGKYPVTNGEFKKFVDDGGYGEDWKSIWSEEGWTWRAENDISEPEYWHNRKWNAPNFPVVGISWYEAEAYANWQSEREGIEDRDKRYRLPSEAEWEKAARGIEGRKYPWDDQFDKNLCNSAESGLSRTSPVGIFPKGKSPSGCFDMAGNVWEWCSDWFDDSYYANSPDKNPKGPKTGANRVARGGGWSVGAGSCMSAFRDCVHPTVRFADLGLRLVRSL